MSDECLLVTVASLHTDDRYPRMTSGPHPDSAHSHSVSLSLTRTPGHAVTHRDVDDQLVVSLVVAHDGPLHLPAHVGEVHPLAGHQLLAPRHAREARPYQLGLEVLAHFSAVIKSHWVSGGLAGQSVRLTAPHGLDGAGVEPPVLPRGHYPRAEDGPLGQPLARRHGVALTRNVCGDIIIFAQDSLTLCSECVTILRLDSDVLMIFTHTDNTGIQICVSSWKCPICCIFWFY